MQFINTRLLIILLICIGKSSIYSQVIPDFEMTFKVINEFGEDSVNIGLSTQAGNGFDVGYDIVDTSEWQLPVDLRIYDPFAVEQLGDSCKHFSTSYLDLPSQNTYQIDEFEREFTLALHIDLEKINNWAQGSTCEDERVLTGTYLRYDLSSMYEYQFRNNIGFDFDLIDIRASGNINLVATDGYYYRTLISPEAYCLSMQTNRSSASPACNVDIFFRVTLIMKNRLYVDTKAVVNKLNVVNKNNIIYIDNALPYTTFTLFSIHGKLLHHQYIKSNQVLVDVHSFNENIFILQLFNPANSHYLTHKIFNL